MTILQQPDALSLSGNIKDFRISTPGKISFVLLQGATEILSQSYDPGQDGLVTISLKDIIHSCLSFQLQQTSQVYLQPSLAGTFTARFSDEYVVNPDVSGEPVYTDITFRAVRAGIDRFADTVTNFLTQNFLTWQPSLKPVTYYSPEFLTYYAVVSCVAKLRAYFTDQSGSVTTQKDITLSDFEVGKAYTIPLQYASVAGKLGNELPGYYDVWIENPEGARLTYVQRYYASSMLSEQEQWILFENSLGGIDTFRAYGSSDFTGEHTHNIAQIDNNSLEYRVDTERKFQKNTGHLNAQERRWLLDFFPSLSKYIYAESYLRPIVVTESNVTYTDRDLPSNYTFTYKYADARPLLNLPRTEPSGDLSITVPSVGSFTVPPRLVEFPRLPLTEGALFPVQDPYSEKWYTATSGSLSDFIANRLSENYSSGGGIGHQHDNIDLLQLFNYVSEYLLIAGKKMKAGYADESYTFEDNTSRELITFLEGLVSKGLIEANGGLVVRNKELIESRSILLVEESADSLVEESTTSVGASTLGELTNVDSIADDSPDGSILVSEGKKWIPKIDLFLPTGVTEDGTEIRTFESLMAYIGQLAPTGVQRNLRINNNLDSKNVSASKGDPCPLSFTFISQERNSISEPYEDTGERGLCQISVKNTDNADFTVVKQLWITSGFPFSFDCAEWLTSGANNIMIKVTGEITGDTTPAFVYTVQLTSLSLSANNFKWWTAYTGDITLPLNIGGNVSKTLYVTVTGTGYKESYIIPVGTGVYTETAYNYVVKHPGRSGVYQISAYVTNSDGTIRTRTLSFHVICATTGSRTKLIAINNVLAKATNWSENTLFEYAMYDGDNVTTSAQFRVTKDNSTIFSSSEDSIATSTKHSFSFPLEVETIDNTEFSIVSQVMDGDAVLSSPMTFLVNNTAGYAAVSGSTLYINPKTRSNRQDNYKDLVNEIDGSTIAATWENMNWGNDGWTTDSDGNRLCRVMAGSLLTIAHKPFAKECARIGKTIEIDYVITNVTDFSEPVITISTPVGASFIGLNIYADDVIMYSQSLKSKSVQSLHTFEEKRTRLTLTILPDAYGNSGFNLVILYINGIKNREFTYENNDYFAHQGDIIIGSDYADVDIYGIREYPFALTSQGVLTNYVNFLSTIDEKVALRVENDILDSNGSEIDFDNVKDQFNVLVYDQKIPSVADKTTRVGTLEAYYFDHPEWNVSISHVTAKGQGTSSMKYWIWNTRYQLDKVLSVITHADGTTSTKKWQFVPWVPAGQKFTAKKNYASSMQSHKIGAVNSYDDLFREVGLLNEAMRTEKYKDARVSVYQLPFFCFEKSINEEGATVHAFKGLYTMGPDKGDKYCFGYDTDLFPGLISIEGADNSPLLTLFRVPWNTSSGRIVYNEDEEAFQYNGANSWDFGAGEVSNISKFIPAYNLVYQCSPRLKPFVGTLEELHAQTSTLRTEPCEFWIAKAGDINQYNVYYFEAAENRFVPSDIGSGTINLNSQLIDKGYGLSSSDLAGKTPEALNALFIAARVAKFRAEAPQHWDIEDSLFFMNNVEFHAGTDERAKNTYPYNFGTETSKWRWRVDDADTRFDTTNRGLPDKSYSVETHDVDENGTTIWNGETNNFFNLMELAFPEEKITSMRSMMTAMQTLGGLNSGSELDKIYAFYKKYYFSQAQEYFPENAYNADAKYCYENGKLAYINGSYSNDTDPITQSLGDHYLAEQRWITKRIIYMMSKYSYGLFSAGGSDMITVRAAGDTIQYELTPAMDVYPAIANGTSIIRGARTKAGEVCRMEIELSGSGDQQNIIHGASYLQDIGDWYDKNVSGSMGIQGKMLRDIRLGSQTDPIVISISSLTISNCISLQRLLLSNISSLSGSLNLLPCTHLQEVYADGTSLVQLRLPIGGGLRVVEFSAYNQYLTLQNYPLLTNEGIGIDLCKEVITDFFVVDCPKMNPMGLLVDIMNAQIGQGAAHALKRIRAVGFDETYRNSAVLDKLAELTDGSYEGLSSEGLAGEDALPVLDGVLNVYANAHEDAVVMLRNTFKKLLLTVVGNLYASFKDNLVEEIVANKWGDGVGITNTEIAGVTNVGTIFRGTTITYFDEFIKFTSAIAGVEDKAFQNCTMLKSVSLPEQYKDANNYSMFLGCTSLESVTIPDSFTYISGAMFKDCLSLKSIRLPMSLKSIKSQAFMQSGLTEIELPDSVEVIDHRDAFNGCLDLERAVMGENLKTIGMACFENCLNMKTIILKTKIPPTYEFNAMGWNNTSSIYVPDESLAAYRVASGWSANNIKVRLKPMSEYTES